MLQRSGPKPIIVRAGCVSVLAIALLAYAGVFDGIIQAIAPAVYDFLRALNRE